MKDVAGWYAKQEGIRDAWLEKVRAISELTCRGLYSHDSYRSTQYREISGGRHQSFGEHLTNSLTNKLLYTLFPPTEPVIRLQADPLTLRTAASLQAQKLAEQGQENINVDDLIADLHSQVEAFFVEREESARMEFNALKLRSILHRDIKESLIVAGQSLLYVPLDPKDDGVRYWGFDKVVSTRDGTGACYKWATKDCYAYESLDEEARAFVKERREKIEDEDEPTVDYYIYGCLKNGKWYVTHELEGDTFIEEDFKKDLCPYMIAGGENYYDENYRRGLWESHFEDLTALEGIRKAVRAGCANAALLNKVFIRKGSGVNVRRFLNSGPLYVGNPEDFRSPEVGNQGIMAVLLQEGHAISEHLSRVFLQISSAIRDSERTTRAEVVLTKEDLETAGIGGIVSVYNDERVLPLYRILMHRTQKRHGKDLPPLPDFVVPVVATGSEALGRGLAGSRLIRMTSDLVAATSGKASLYAQKIGDEYFRSGGFNSRRFIPSEEAVAQAQQAQQAQAAQIEAMKNRASQPDAPPQQ